MTPRELPVLDFVPPTLAAGGPRAEAPGMEAADLVVINTCAIREAAEAPWPAISTSDRIVRGRAGDVLPALLGVDVDLGGGAITSRHRRPGLAARCRATTSPGANRHL